MKKQRICLAAVLVFCLAVLAAGCGSKEKETPETSLKNYTEAVVHFDEESAKKIGKDTEELKKSYEAAAKKGLSRNTHRAGHKYSKEDIDAYSETMWGGFVELMPRSSVTVNIVKADEQTATAEITADVFDCPAAAKEVTDNLKGNVAGMTDGQILQAIGRGCAEKFKTLQPVRQQTITVQCTYMKKDNRWEPNGGLASFSDKLYMTITGQAKDAEAKQ